jgi:uncharacterized protein YqgC (DUF456 family)
MLYSIFLLLIGVYVGQEYPVIPSVKLITLSLLRYIKDKSEEVDKDPELRSNQNMQNFLSNFIKSIYKTDKTDKTDKAD